MILQQGSFDVIQPELNLDEENSFLHVGRDFQIYSQETVFLPVDEY